MMRKVVLLLPRNVLSSSCAGLAGGKVVGVRVRKRLYIAVGDTSVNAATVLLESQFVGLGTWTFKSADVITIFGAGDRDKIQIG